jgi:hypothetical protein
VTTPAMMPDSRMDMTRSTLNSCSVCLDFSTRR